MRTERLVDAVLRDRRARAGGIEETVRFFEVDGLSQGDAGADPLRAPVVSVR